MKRAVEWTHANSAVINVILTIALVVASGFSACAAVQSGQVQDRLAKLELQRESVDIRFLGIQRIDEEGHEWGFLLSNHGHRDVSIYSIEVRIQDELGNVTLGGVPLEQRGDYDFNARVVPGGGAVWAETRLQFPVNLTKEGVTRVTFIANPVVGEVANCPVVDFDMRRVLQAGNPLDKCYP